MASEARHVTLTPIPPASATEQAMERRRRTSTAIAGDREAMSIAASLGREVQATRRRRRLRQSDLAAAVGLAQARISDIERGAGTGTPLLVWVRLGIALGRPLAASFSRDLEPPLPADAGHLAAQELLLRLVRATGRTGMVESPTQPDNPSLSVDVCIRDDRYRALILNEIWNRTDDLGRALRSSDRKTAEAAELATGIGGDRPYRIASCWLLVDSAANRALAARYPEILAARFPGSSVGWVRCLTEGGEPPHRAGIAWIDLRSGRIVPMRRHSRQRNGGTAGRILLPHA
jgi:transcriptional regulator with XRE-family HTH domain